MAVQTITCPCGCCPCPRGYPVNGCGVEASGSDVFYPCVNVVASGFTSDCAAANGTFPMIAASCQGFTHTAGYSPISGTGWSMLFYPGGLPDTSFTEYKPWPFPCFTPSYVGYVLTPPLSQGIFYTRVGNLAGTGPWQFDRVQPWQCDDRQSFTCAGVPASVMVEAASAPVAATPICAVPFPATVVANVNWSNAWFDTPQPINGHSEFCTCGGGSAGVNYTLTRSAVDGHYYGGGAYCSSTVAIEVTYHAISANCPAAGAFLHAYFPGCNFDFWAAGTLNCPGHGFVTVLGIPWNLGLPCCPTFTHGFNEVQTTLAVVVSG